MRPEALLNKGAAFKDGRHIVRRLAGPAYAARRTSAIRAKMPAAYGMTQEDRSALRWLWNGRSG